MRMGRWKTTETWLMLRFRKRLASVVFLSSTALIAPGSHAQGRQEGLAGPGYEIVYATYLGGSEWDQAREVIPYPDGSVLIGAQTSSSNIPTTEVVFAGHTTSPDLPTTSGAAQSRHGGQHDAYVVKLSGDGTRLLYVTYVGGHGNEFPEHRPYIGLDGSLLLPGVSASDDFPTTPGVFQGSLKGKNDAFLTKLSADGRRFVLSTLLGGSATEFSLMPVLGDHGGIFLVGQTESRDLPVTANALQAKHGGGKSDGFLAVLAPDASDLLYCTYLGGSGNDMIRRIALAPGDEIYLVGHTASEDFPVTPSAVQEEYGGKGDAFVVKLVVDQQ